MTNDVGDQLRAAMGAVASGQSSCDGSASLRQLADGRIASFLPMSRNDSRIHLCPGS